MRQYQFVIGISLALLQDEVNRLAAESPELTLNQILHVPGQGFVGIIERHVEAAPHTPLGPGKPGSPKSAASVG